MVRGRGLQLLGVLRFAISCLSVGMDLGLVPRCRFRSQFLVASNSQH